MTRQDWILIGLSLQLSVMSWLLVQAAHTRGYLEGRQSVYTELAAQPDDGTCLVPSGCDDDVPSKPIPHSHYPGVR